MSLFNQQILRLLLSSLFLLAAVSGCATKPSSPAGDGPLDNEKVTQTVTDRQASGSVEAASAVPVPSEPVVLQPHWQLGDRWLYSDGYGLEVDQVAGSLATLKRIDVKDQWQRREGFFVVESKDSRSVRKVVFRTRDPAEIFPLAVGKRSVFKREYVVDGQTRVHNTSWIVTGREKIRVPAGEFDCWILVRRTRSLQTDWTGYERLWYSDAVRNYVRMEYRYGAAPSSSRVLMAYRLM